MHPSIQKSLDDSTHISPRERLPYRLAPKLDEGAIRVVVERGQGSGDQPAGGFFGRLPQKTEGRHTVEWG